jgi:hypothetical protein
MAYNFHSLIVREIRYMMPWFQHPFLVPVSDCYQYISVQISSFSTNHLCPVRLYFCPTKKYESEIRRCVFLTVSVCFHPSWMSQTGVGCY